jgi:ribosome-associated protein
MQTADGARVDALRVNASLAIPLAEISLRSSRSSGPGGQHANVTASRVEASFDVRSSRTLSESQRERLLARAGARVTAVAQDARSQARNRELALQRLGERLASALRTPAPRTPTSPTRASRERRLEDKRRTAARKRERRPPGPA